MTRKECLKQAYRDQVVYRSGLKENHAFRFEGSLEYRKGKEM